MAISTVICINPACRESVQSGNPIVHQNHFIYISRMDGAPFRNGLTWCAQCRQYSMRPIRLSPDYVGIIHNDGGDRFFNDPMTDHLLPDPVLFPFLPGTMPNFIHLPGAFQPHSIEIPRGGPPPTRDLFAEYRRAHEARTTTPCTRCEKRVDSNLLTQIDEREMLCRECFRAHAQASMARERGSDLSTASSPLVTDPHDKCMICLAEIEIVLLVYFCPLYVVTVFTQNA